MPQQWWPTTVPAPVPGSRRRRALVGAALLMLPVVAALAVELGGFVVVGSALDEGELLRAQHQYPQAEAQLRATAARSGPAYLLARGRISSAASEASATDLDWARYLASTGKLDESLVVLGRVGGSQAAEAHREAGELVVAAAASAAKAGHFDEALHRLDQVRSSGAPRDQVASAQAMRPALELSAAQAELEAGRPVDALTILDSLAATPAIPGPVSGAARAAIPGALLTAARQLAGAGNAPSALPFLHRLTDQLPTAPEAAAARTLLAAPQRVTGTLVHRDGSPAGRTPVRLGSNFRLDQGGFITDSPYYGGSTDASGIFEIDGVPVGTALVFEFNDGGWTVRTGRDPAGREQPADKVTIAPLTPTDLGFVREP